jgi:hypothetical protein
MLCGTHMWTALRVAAARPRPTPTHRSLRRTHASPLVRCAAAPSWHELLHLCDTNQVRTLWLR